MLIRSGTGTLSEEGRGTAGTGRDGVGCARVSAREGRSDGRIIGRSDGRTVEPSDGRMVGRPGVDRAAAGSESPEAARPDQLAGAGVADGAGAAAPAPPWRWR